MVIDNSGKNDLLDALAEDFVTRYRRGDRPTLNEFITRHPELADEIRDLFPALAMMEEARPRADDGGARRVELDRHALLDRLGEYRILREVGRGGMGIVYEAEQESLGRHVAVKVLPAHSLLEPRYLQRFQREARAAARLHHTNIVPVFGVGEHDGLNYYVMQFIQGRGLDEVLVEIKRLRRHRSDQKSAAQSPHVPEVPTWDRCTRAADRGMDASADRIAEGLLSGQFQASSIPTTEAPSDRQDGLPTMNADPRKHDGTSHCGAQGWDPNIDNPPSDVCLPGQDRNSSRSEAGREYWLGVARVGMQVADALAYANSQGVLHRDIKPSNLLLDTKGTVWVTDFGLAKDNAPVGSTDGDIAGRDLTRSGDVVGTLRYLAPERLKGDSDQRSDLYSLGATLYEMLTLRPPFDDSDRSVLVRRLLHDEPVRPRARDPSIPLDLETIVVKAMAKDPADRYGSPAELADDLRCFLADRPIRARRATVWERTWRVCRRNPVISSLSAAVLVLASALSAGAIVAGWIRSERDQALANLTRAERAERSANLNLQRAQRAERDARVRAHLTQAILDRKRGAAGHRARGLREIDRALALQPSDEMQCELRNELIAALAQTDVSRFSEWECPNANLDVDERLENYARQTRDGVISIRRIADDQELLRLQRPPGPDQRARVLFSPNGQYLASFTFDHHLMVWALSTGQLVLDDVGCEWEFSFDFTADSQSIVAGHDEELLVLDLASGQVTSRWPVEFAPWCVSCGPDVDRVAISPIGEAAAHKLQVLSCSTGELTSELRAPGWIFDIAWHPDGKTIAFGCGDKNIYLWTVGQPRPHRKLIGSLAQGIILSFSHDGKLLASGSWGSESYLWEPTTGEVLCTVTTSLACVRFSPDDRHFGLFRNGASIGVYEVVASDVFRYLLPDDGETGAIRNAAFSSDGRLLAVGTSKGLEFLDFTTGHELAFAPIGMVAYLQFDGDGLLTAPGTFNRWPMRTASQASGQVIVGPPEHIPLRVSNEFDISRDGTVVAVAQYHGAAVMHTNRPERPIRLSPHEDCRYVAVSGDGRWVATGSHWGAKVKVWNAASGKLMTTLPVETASRVRFSPDGRWLATTGDGGRFWEVGTWESGPRVEGVQTFSPDGKMVAVDNGYGYVRLVESGTLHEIARLEHPKRYGSERYVFAPDCSALVGVVTAKISGFAWDLRRLREHLAERDLDWDLPSYPPPASVAGPAHLEVELIVAGTGASSREDRARRTIAQFREAHYARPNDGSTCNELARALATAPEPLRMPDEALQLAKKANSLDPGDARRRNTLGVAYYRAGRFREAADCLAANLSQQEDAGLAYDLYFLAMSFQQLGQSDRAREHLIWANRWVASRTSEAEFTTEQLAELTAFQHEAEALIGSDAKLNVKK